MIKFEIMVIIMKTRTGVFKNYLVPFILKHHSLFPHSHTFLRMYYIIALFHLLSGSAVEIGI